MEPRLKERYKSEILPALMKEFSYTSPMAAPKLEKIILNMGVGREAQTNPKVFDQAAMELSTVSGQKPIVTKAKKSIAAFKLRTGMPVGVAVTLRGERMYEFLDRFINAVLPRVRDFRGISPRAFDGRGNYTIGIKDQLIFPEIDFNKVDRTRGMNICIVTTARTDEEGRALLRQFGMPFMK
ncbi:MAG TPA: 50S ribosomal protein L5 [Blastocatellia bacterium]|jgi:large subunit ribosomal protein L5|nr:50S ribosomal protein L5 [Blastocatellia bacterium]